MDEKYFAQKIEQKWQKRWAENKTFEVEADDTREKFYALEMLPYPSGRLHMGHVRNYSIGDALSWYKRLQGYNVLHPIGWDSFGQPAEQAAIKKGVNPRDWTEENIRQMREQMQRLGISYDWSREIAAHRPEYYKFDQWFFLKMYEMGLVYQKDSQVNWCPKCETTLSNEQASGGVCWRCGTPVEKQSRKQWFVKITKYAEELLQDMSNIKYNWAERVLTMQRNWIGKSEGAFVDFGLRILDCGFEEKANPESRIPNPKSVRVFTTRIDTIYGANAIVVAAEHPIVEANFNDLSDEVKAKIEEIKIEKAKPMDYGEEVEKDGIDTGLKAINPFSGEELPVWVGNYVMMEYGTGAVMSVPAHDERDFEFAKKFGLPIKEVISKEQEIQLLKTAYNEEVELFENPKLSEQELDIQEKTFAYLQENVEELIEKYYATHGKQIINADKSKELFDVYNENRLENDRAVQPTASALTRLILKRRLNELPEGSTIVLTAGGQASGKSTVIRENFNADLIYDSVMASASGNRKVIDLIAEKGHFARIIYVYRPIKFAVVGMLRRQIIEGRPVSEDNMASGHFGSEQAFITDTDEYARSKGFTVAYSETVENGESKQISLNELKEKAYNSKEEVLQKIIYGINEYRESNKQRNESANRISNSEKENDASRIRGVVQGNRPTDNQELGFGSSSDGAAATGRADLGLARADAREREILEAFTDYGFLVNSGEWSGKTSSEAMREMTKFAEKNGFGEAATTYRLRDWGISRQRFWGAPIPIIFCETCGAVPEKVENLPVELPETAPFTGIGESPLAKVPAFYETTCPNCNEPARRETDTMDTFVDSTWYYFRYTDPHNSEMPFNPEIAAYWLPVDQYIGGVDHAVMHLLYTRFWTKMMRDIGLISFDEPVKNLLTQGMVVGESYYSDEKASYVPLDEVEIMRDERGKVVQAKLKSDNSPIKVAVEKMSKSKYNGVDPDDMVSIYGADSARIFALFAAPAENELVWQETGIEGAYRFLQRVYRLVYRWHSFLRVESQESRVESKSEPPPLTGGLSDNAKKLRRKTHQTIKRITENFESFQFNTPVAALMELSNALGDFKVEPKDATDAELFAVDEALKSLILMLTPYAPHFTEEMWEILTADSNGILQSGARFPIANEKLASADELEIPIQVNGKLRARVMATPTTSKEDLEAMALADAKIKEYTDGKQIVKIIVVPNRLVNIVVK